MLATKKIGKPISGQNDEKHNALMNEFKKAHKKMFKNGFLENDVNSTNENVCIDKLFYLLIN